MDCAILDGDNEIIAECFEKVGRTSEGRFLERPAQRNAAHIMRCVNEREELLRELKTCVLALRSYQCGNRATDLAQEIADHAEELLAKGQP